MFPKAAIKRFNDVTNETPGPLEYDPKEPKSRGTNAAMLKSERFVEPFQLTTPGPGHYDTSIKTKNKTVSQILHHTCLPHSKAAG